MTNDALLFSLDSGKELLQRVATELGVIPGRHEERLFEDGEHKIRALEPVRGRDVYLVQSLYRGASASVDDQLVKLLFFIGSLRDAGAARITLYAPYLCYMRKERRTKFQDPLSSRYLAQLFETLGLARLAVFDVHNVAAFENAFRCRTVHLSAHAIMAQHFVSLLNGAAVAVASPDISGAKRAEQFRLLLADRLGKPVESVLLEKYRSEGVVSGGRLLGEVAGRAVIILDDLICAGTTMRRAAEACREGGAEAVYVAATHGVFTPAAQSRLATPMITGLVTSNTVTAPPFPGLGDRHQVLDIAPLIAESIVELSREALCQPNSCSA